MRNRLVAAVLTGRKTATCSLLAEWEHDGEPLPVAGERQIVVDSGLRRVATIEIVAVDVVRLGDVDIAFAREEGEGFESVSHWRDAHEMFWTDEVMPRLAERARCTLHDDTLVVSERFRGVLAPNQ
jgi:uncharacterized protein YhfF